MARSSRLTRGGSSYKGGRVALTSGLISSSGELVGPWREPNSRPENREIEE